MEYMEIQKGTKQHKLRGFLFRDGDTLLYHYFDTETQTVPTPHTIGTFAGSSLDLDVTTNGKYAYITALGSLTVAKGNVVSATSTTTTLDTGVPATAGSFVGRTLRIVSGTGTGSFVTITAFSDMRVVTHAAWVVTPDSTSKYAITADVNNKGTGNDGGKPIVLSHDGTSFRTPVDMGALVADGGTWSGVTNFATGGKLKDAAYAVTWRRFNPSRNVTDGLREIKDAAAALTGSTQRFVSAPIGPSGDFTHIQLFRSVANGGRLYLESTFKYTSSADTAVAMEFGTRSDSQLQTKDDLYEPILDAVALPPEAQPLTQPRIAAYQGIVIQKLEGLSVDDTLSDLVYSPLHVKAPENYPTDNTFPLPVEESPILSLIEASDYLFALTPIATIRFQRSGSRMAINKTSLGYGPTSRFAAVAIGPAIIVASPRGLYMIEGATGDLQLFNAVSRLMTHDGEWLPDMISDLRNENVTPNLHLAFDEPSSLVFITCNAKQQCVVLNMRNGRISTLDDWPYTLSTTGPHPRDGGAKRAWFAGVKTNAIPAFVHTDKLFFPNVFREGPLTMSGTLDPTTEVNGTATGGTTVSLTDSSNFMGPDVQGSFIHVWITDPTTGVETRYRRFAVPNPALILDDFNRADATDLGVGWSQIGSGTSDWWNTGWWSTQWWNVGWWASATSAAIHVQSNTAKSNDLNATPIEYSAMRSVPVGQDDYDIEAEFTADATSTPWFQLHGRRSTSNSSDPEGYVATCALKTATVAGRTLLTNTVTLEYVDSLGVHTSMGNVGFTFTPGVKYTINFSLRKNVLSVKITDPTFTSFEVIRRVLDQQAIIAGAQFKKDDLATAHVAMCRIDSSRFFITYQETATFLTYALIATVSGTSVTFGTKLNIVDGVPINGFWMDCVAVDANTVLMTCFDNVATPNGGEGKLFNLVVTDTSVSINSINVFAPSVDNTEGARYSSISRMDDGTYAISWIDWERDSSGANKKFTRTRILFDLSIMSMGPTVDIHASRTQDLTVETVGLNASTFAVIYSDLDDQSKGKFKICSTTSVGVITQGAATNFHGSSNGVLGELSATRWSDTEFVILYDAVLEQEGRAVVVTVSGLVGTVGTPSAKISDGIDATDITVLSQDTLSFGTNQEFSSSFGNNADGMAIVSLSPTKVMVAYNDGSTGAFVKVGTVSGTTITWGTQSSAFGTTGSTRQFALAPLSPTVVVIGWNDFITGNEPFLVVATVSGVSVTLGTQTVTGDIELVANNTTLVDIATVDSTHAMFIWRIGGSGVKARIVQVTGSTISLGSFQNIGNALGVQIEGLKLVMMDSSRWLAAFSTTAANAMILKTGTTTGLTITLPDANTTFSGGAGSVLDYISVGKLTSTTAVISFQDNNGSSVFGTAVVVTVTGAAITVGQLNIIEHVTLGTVLTGLDVAVFTPTTISISWVDNGAGDTGNSKFGTVAGNVITFDEKQVWFQAEQTGGLENTVHAASIDANGFILVAQNQSGNAGVAFIGQPTGLNAKRLVAVYRDFAADNFAKSRIGDVTGGIVQWVEFSQILFPTTPTQIFFNQVTGLNNKVSMVDYDTAIAFTQDFEDGNKGKAVLLEIPTLGAAQILLTGGFAGFGVSFDGDGTESVTTDNFKIISDGITIGLTPALPTPVLSGSLYSIAPIPFKVTLWPLDAQGGKLDYFQRRSIQTLGIALGDYVPASNLVNSRFRMQTFTEGSETEDTFDEVPITLDKGAMWGGLKSFGQVVQPGFECYSSDEDFQVLAAKVNGTRQDTNIDA